MLSCRDMAPWLSIHSPTAPRGEGGAVRHQRGESHRRWLIDVMLFMPYDTESKSRNADFISIARRAIRNPRPERPSNLRTLRTFGAKPRQPSHRRCVQGHINKSLADTSAQAPRLYDQRGEKAWRRLSQSPRRTIHGSREEGPDAFMNFTSPARRKLHKNS